MAGAAVTLENAGRGLEGRVGGEIRREKGLENGNEEKKGEMEKSEGEEMDAPTKSKKVQFSPWTPQRGSI